MSSCTFMEIAKKYGVDYGDVLLATEAFRHPDIEPWPHRNNAVDAVNRLPGGCVEAISYACRRRWRN